MDRRIPTQIQPIIETYVTLTNRSMVELIDSIYIVGSIALDGFNDKYSDIDFITILNRKASMEEIEKLGEIHRKIETEFTKWKMSGIYLEYKDVGKSEKEIEPHPYFHDGKMHASGYFEINPVTWWVLKNHGVTVKGVDPQDLSFEVDWDVLISRMRENLNTYWYSWVRRIDRYLAMLTDWGIQWTVLGVLRQYYSFQENEITTKEKAGEYAIHHLPDRWKPLIQEALNIRSGQNEREYGFRIKRMLDDVAFLNFVIQTSNNLLDKN